GAIVRIDEGFKCADQKLRIAFALAFTELAVEIRAVFLDTLTTAVVNGDDNEVAKACFCQLGQMPVDRPVAKGCAVIKKILRILQIKNRESFVGIEIVIRQ